MKIGWVESHEVNLGMGQDSLCLLHNLPDVCSHMLEPLVSIRLLGHVIGTDIDKHLARLHIQK